MQVTVAHLVSSRRAAEHPRPTRARQPDIPSRPDARRRLVHPGLEASELAGLEREERIMFLSCPESSAKLAEASPSGRLPGLDLDGLRLWDSLAIAESLRERHLGCGIWPADRAACAMARGSAEEVHAGVHDPRAALPMHLVKRSSNRPQRSLAAPMPALARVRRSPCWRTWANRSAKFTAGTSRRPTSVIGRSVTIPMVSNPFRVIGQAAVQSREPRDADVVQQDGVPLRPRLRHALCAERTARATDLHHQHALAKAAAHRLGDPAPRGVGRAAGREGITMEIGCVGNAWTMPGVATWLPAGRTPCAAKASSGRSSRLA
jgi:hypothetical protein